MSVTGTALLSGRCSFRTRIPVVSGAAGGRSSAETAASTAGRLTVFSTRMPATTPTSVVAASLPGLNLVDYYLPSNWLYLRNKDLDLGSASPVFFSWHDRYFVAHGAKEGVLYIMDADAL